MFYYVIVSNNPLVAEDSKSRLLISCGRCCILLLSEQAFYLSASCDLTQWSLAVICIEARACLYLLLLDGLTCMTALKAFPVCLQET